MATNTHHIKSMGIYGISETAVYLSATLPQNHDVQVKSSRLRYWIRTGASHVSDPLFPTTKRLITFQDVISMRMIAILRAKKIPLQKIRLMESWAKSTFHTDWPFAFRPMWTYASDVFIEFEHELIAATRYGQIAMEFIRQWLEEVNLDMTFDRDDIADSWSPRSGIELNPHIQFGEPCVKGTDIPTKALWSKIRAGDPPSVVASLYEIEESSVRDAVAWEKSLAEAA